MKKVHARSFTAVCLGFVLSVGGVLAAPNSAFADGPNSSANVSAYVVHVNDQLSITVLGHDEYGRNVTVLSDGTFTYPIVGIVHAAGLTISQLTRSLQKGLSSEFTDPLVTISITQFVAPSVSVVGSVSKAGLYPFQDGWHVINAIAAAGGLSVATNQTQITIVRSGLNPITVDSVKLFDGDDASQNPAVEPGDTILVQQKDALSTNIQVSGEVKSPGLYPAPATGESPLAALVAAGGTNDDAQLSGIQLSHNGQVTTLDLRTVNETLLNPQPLPLLMPGDVLLVPKNPKKISVLGDVNAPQVYYLPEDKPTTLTDAITLARGGMEDADLSKVAIYRNVDGKAAVQTVDLGKVLRGDGAAADPVIQPGDVVYVPVKGQRINDSPLVFLLGPLLALTK